MSEERVRVLERLIRGNNCINIRDLCVICDIKLSKESEPGLHTDEEDKIPPIQ